MLPFDEARARVLADVTVLAAERVSVADAIGRVLSNDVFAHGPLPSFDYSAMDGYAVCASDVTAVRGMSLTVVGESRTGGDLPGEVSPGTTCRIFTGARIPPRADAVVMQERVRRTGELVRFDTVPVPGANIRRAGEDLAVGARALAAGTRVTPYHLGLLTALECAWVTVARRPVVSILSTGDELRDVGDPARDGAVVDSNSPTLAAVVTRCGGTARRMPHGKDDPESLRVALRAALDGADVVLTVGGVSVGDHDLVRAAMQHEGINLDFWQVAIRPGKPLALGRAPQGQRVLALPGNPASATLTLTLFGAPLIRALQGDTQPVPMTVTAVLTEPLVHTPGRMDFVRSWLDESGDGARVRPLANQSSGAVTAFAWANALTLVPLESTGLPAGATVRCIRLGDV